MVERTEGDIGAQGFTTPLHQPVCIGIGIARKILSLFAARVGSQRRVALLICLFSGVGAALAENYGDEWLKVTGPGYAGGTVQWGEGVGGLEIWGERYLRNIASYYASAGILSAHDFEERFYSLSVGARTNYPARISPFLGLGGYFGISDAEAQFVTTDGQKSSLSLVFNGLSVYPEAGVQLAISRRSRLMAMARYYFDLDDDHPGQWAFGGGLSMRWN